jgi:hypothetical protein
MRRALVLVGLVVAVAVQVSAQEKSLTGTWSLQSLILDEDGKKSEPFGSPPQGLMMLDGKRLMYTLMRPDLPKIAANSRLKATPEE